MTTETVVVGVMLLQGGRREELESLFEEDYAYLRSTYPEFLRGRCVESTTEAGAFFHLTEWTSQDAMARARQDPFVLEIFSRVPAHLVVGSHVCVPIVDSSEESP